MISQSIAALEIPPVQPAALEKVGLMAIADVSHILSFWATLGAYIFSCSTLLVARGNCLQKDGDCLYLCGLNHGTKLTKLETTTSHLEYVRN